MIKKIIIMTICLLMVHALAYASCPKYVIGFQGTAQISVAGMRIPMVGAQVVLTTPEGQSVEKYTDANGKYRATLRINNCHEEIGLFTQSWSVKLDGTPAGFPVSRTCETEERFFCCSEQAYNQKVVKRCNLYYKLLDHVTGY